MCVCEGEGEREREGLTLEVCASSTSFTICANMASEPTCVASIKSTPFMLREPPITDPPASLVTGMASPVRGGGWGGGEGVSEIHVQYVCVYTEWS